MKKTIQTILLGFQLISFSCSVSDPLDSESVSINTDQAITLKTVHIKKVEKISSTAKLYWYSTGTEIY